MGLVAPPALSPLVVPRAYRYDRFRDRLDVVVAGQGGQFGIYHELFCDALEFPRSDFVGRRSGASRQDAELAALAPHGLWMVLIDQGLEPTLRIGDTRRLDWRSDGGRDLLTVTAYPHTVEQLIANALQQAGLVPTEATVTRAFVQMFGLSSEALLCLARPKVGQALIESRTAQGLVGVLAAARWYERTYPDAVLISLDDPNSRRWVLGLPGEDHRHGDLLAVRPDGDRVVVEAIEVKATGGDGALVSVRGDRAEGEAVTQVDQTLATLERLFAAPAGAGLDAARRELLRDQLYRAVASRPYGRDQRGRFVEMLNELFGGSPPPVRGLVVQARIESGSSAPAPSRPLAFRTPSDRPMGWLELVEGEADPAVARPAPTPPAPTPPPPPPPPAARTPPAPPPPPPRTAPRQAAARTAPQSPPPAARQPEPNDRPRVLIGRDPNDKEVYWDPHHPERPLNNFGLLVTGDSGVGKTQFLRALIDELAGRGLPVCVFDFKNDYAEEPFSHKAGLRVYDVRRDGLPFNPLSLVPEADGTTQPIQQIHELAGILERVFALGPQQTAALRKAMKQVFTTAGIDPQQRYRVSEAPPAPGFSEVGDLLEHGARNAALLNKLSPLFDLNLFPAAETAATTFERLLNDRVVLDLHALPSDKIKAVLAEFLIVRLHGHALRGEQPRQLRRLLVFDEAWRVAQSQRLQELAREGRAFGIGLAIGTQFPNLPTELTGNLATRLLLHNSDPEHQRKVAAVLCGSATGPLAGPLIGRLKQLQKHEGFLSNQQYTPYVFVRSSPHYERG